MSNTTRRSHAPNSRSMTVALVWITGLSESLPVAAADHDRATLLAIRSPTSRCSEIGLSKRCRTACPRARSRVGI